MPNCDNCKNGYYDSYFDSEGIFDTHFVCEKGLEPKNGDFECEGFEPEPELKIKETPKEYQSCDSCSLQGCTIYFKNEKDLKCGDTFILTSMSRSSTCGIYGVELQKVYPYNDNLTKL